MMEANEFSLEKMLMARAAAQYRPVNGSIELLPLCNMNCRMCYVRLSHQEMDKLGALHPVEEWMRVAEEMQKAGVVFMLLTVTVISCRLLQVRYSLCCIWYGWLLCGST